MTKIFYLYDKFFESNRNFTTKQQKILKFQVFLVIFVQSSFFFSKFPKIQFFFCLNCRIPGFFRILGKVATLCILNVINSIKLLIIISSILVKIVQIRVFFLMLYAYFLQFYKQSSDKAYHFKLNFKFRTKVKTGLQQTQIV